MSLADTRREYTGGGLRRADLDANPILQFQKWFTEAEAALARHQLDVNAATLATADKNGIPSARTVLLKGLGERGFTFFTNYDSRKGRELAENPNAALVFYWQELERQVCIAGSVEKTSREESETLFQFTSARQPARGVGVEPERSRSRPRFSRGEMAGTGKEICHGHSAAAELGRIYFAAGTD